MTTVAVESNNVELKVDAKFGLYAYTHACTPALAPSEMTPQAACWRMRSDRRQLQQPPLLAKQEKLGISPLHEQFTQQHRVLLYYRSVEQMFNNNSVSQVLHPFPRWVL